MLPTEGGEHIFKQMNNNQPKMLLEVDKARTKEQVASEMHKLPCVMCAVVFVGGLSGG